MPLILKLDRAVQEVMSQLPMPDIHDHAQGLTRELTHLFERIGLSPDEIKAKLPVATVFFEDVAGLGSLAELLSATNRMGEFVQRLELPSEKEEALIVTLIEMRRTSHGKSPKMEV